MSPWLRSQGGCDIERPPSLFKNVVCSGPPNLTGSQWWNPAAHVPTTSASPCQHQPPPVTITAKNIYESRPAGTNPASELLHAWLGPVWVRGCIQVGAEGDEKYMRT